MNIEDRRILIGGIILRLLLIPFAAHVDQIVLLWMLSKSVTQFTLNPYEYLYSLGLPYLFPYPPIFYFMMLPYFYLLHITHLIDLEIANSLVNPNLLAPTSWVIDSNIYHKTPINTFLFFSKLPYLAFDLASALILLKIDRRLFNFWIFCPITIYTSYIWGQFDILPIFFVVLALYFANRFFEGNNDRYANLSMLSLGVGAGAKIFPLFFIPFFAVMMGKRSPPRILFLAFIGFMPFCISCLPFISSDAFIRALLKNENFKFTERIINTYNLPLFPASLSLLLLISFLSSPSFKKILQYCFLTLSFFYIFVYWHPQWFTWIMPFMAFLVTEYKAYSLPYIFCVVLWLFYLLLYGYGPYFFSPLIPPLASSANILALLPSLITYYYYILNILLAFVLLFGAYLFIKKENKAPISDKTYTLIPLIISILFLLLPLITTPMYFLTMGIREIQVPMGETIISNASQSFVSHNNGLSRIRVKPAGDYTNACLYLFDGQSGKEIRASCINSTKHKILFFEINPLSLEGLLSFFFEPIQDSKDKEYLFRVEGTSIYYSQKDLYAEGTAYRDGQKIAGDTHFETYYIPTLIDLVLNILKSILGKIGMQKAFFLSYFVLLLIMLWELLRTFKYK
ncbi:MAG: hypothetical protein QXP42_03735 [Candidatus Micrarchaeia archaeon]